jgi:hypothetical protein
MVCVDYVNLLAGNINSKNKNTETLIDASKEVGPEVDAEKSKVMLPSWQGKTIKQRW